jgi:hypothetical protein
MSFFGSRRRAGCFGILALLWLALPTPTWAQTSCGPCATFGTPCAVGCQTHHCPPAFKYCQERPPHIHWSCGCPHPICNPCDLPHWGFYETCWNPWPFPPNWTHCPTPPPSAMVVLNPQVDPRALPPMPPRGFGAPHPGTLSPIPTPPSSEEELRMPRRIDGPLPR